MAWTKNFQISASCFSSKLDHYLVPRVSGLLCLETLSSPLLNASIVSEDRTDSGRELYLSGTLHVKKLLRASVLPTLGMRVLLPDVNLVLVAPSRHWFAARSNQVFGLTLSTPVRMRWAAIRSPRSRLSVRLGRLSSISALSSGFQVFCDQHTNILLFMCDLKPDTTHQVLKPSVFRPTEVHHLVLPQVEKQMPVDRPLVQPVQAVLQPLLVLLELGLGQCVHQRLGDGGDRRGDTGGIQVSTDSVGQEMKLKV